MCTGKWKAIRLLLTIHHHPTHQLTPPATTLCFPSPAPDTVGAPSIAHNVSTALATVPTLTTFIQPVDSNDNLSLRGADRCLLFLPLQIKAAYVTPCGENGASVDDGVSCSW